MWSCLKFYTSVAKGLRVKARKFCRLISRFVEVTGEKLVRGGGDFPPPPPPPPPSLKKKKKKRPTDPTRKPRVTGNEQFF